jgi:hypothetical protein
MSKGDNRKICNKIVIKHAHSWNQDRKEVELYATNLANQVHEHQCIELNGESIKT